MIGTEPVCGAQARPKRTVGQPSVSEARPKAARIRGGNQEASSQARPPAAQVAFPAYNGTGGFATRTEATTEASHTPALPPASSAMT